MIAFHYSHEYIQMLCQTYKVVNIFTMPLLFSDFKRHPGTALVCGNGMECFFIIPVIISP
jgi:hypothetical protein